MIRSSKSFVAGVSNHRDRTPRARMAVLPMLGILLFFSGCVRNVYEIDMSLNEGRVERRFSGASKAKSESREKRLSPAEEARIAAAYGVDVRHEDGKSVVTGIFDGKLPVDVGGAGYLHHYNSPMGTLSVYLERFRGSDDLAARIDRMTEAVSRLVELAQSWVRAEGRDPEIVARVEAYLAEHAQHDLKNFGLLVLTLHAALEFNEFNDKGDAEKFWAEAVARVAQYAVERGYIDFSDVPKIVRLNRADPESHLQWLRELLAKRLETDENGILRAFPALANQRRLEASVLRLASEDELKEVLSDCVTIRLAAFDRVTVRFRLLQRPLAFNGNWLDDGTAEWTAGLDAPGEPPIHLLPVQLFAAWIAPEESYQKQLFGRLMLDGQNLADYVLWYLSLSEHESHQWDVFLDATKPSDTFLVRLNAFRFSAQSDAPGEQKSNLLVEPKRLFKAAMKADSD